MPDPLDPVKVFAATFVISSFAGLASLLRSGKELRLRSVLSAMLNSGLLGLAIAFLWYNYWRENLWFLIGVSLMAGLGGMTMLDFCLMVLRNSGLNVIVRIDDDEHKSKETE
jgi:hypothetical protein